MRRSRLLWLVLPLSAATLIAPSGGNAAAPVSRQAIDVLRPGFQGEDSLAPGDLDARVGSLKPNAGQLAHARRLGAKARWTQFGTPRSLFNRNGYLGAPKKGDPVAIARAWVRDNAALYRLTPALTDEKNLELVANNALYESPDMRRLKAGLKPLAKDDTLPHVVLFRQQFNGVDAGNDGLLTVTLDRQNRVTYVSGSVTGDVRVTNTKKLGHVEAWRRAAADVGWHVPLSDIKVTGTLHDKFTTLKVPGVSSDQLSRLVAVPTPRDGVRLAYEAGTVDNDRVNAKGAEPLAYQSFVDAQTGKVLYRAHAVDYLAHGMKSPATITPRTQTPLDDPRWKVFPNTPQLAVQGVASPDDREMWCWSVETTECDRVIGGSTGHRNKPQLNLAYDVLPVEDETGNVTTAPSLHSQGNDADTTSSYASHLTPDAPRHSTPRADRRYDYEFTDQWHVSNCDLSGNYALNPDNPNDLDAAITNLFVNYGRMHDWSYYLGFWESTWNMQVQNFGEDHEDSDEARDKDPEKGQAQAGAVAGSALFTGRDNANQITLNDGTPGITNQYLWHPLQAAFYSPCVDGAYDMGVVGHEYTHAISNRMIGGPDAGIGGSDGGKMGEGWSDLAAMEYVNGYGFGPVSGENPFAVGPYATGNTKSGIRNYGMNESPLNYSQLLYDGNGQTSPHSDSEIWSAANFNVRQTLVEKYNSQFPYDNKNLQYECADGIRPSTQCPGNRRWIQLMFDGFLIQAANAGMPEAAEAQIAADLVRYGGANQKELWRAYAERGLGDHSEEPGDADWTTPKEAIEAQVRFRAVPVDGGGVPAEMYVHVGPFTGRTTEATVAKANQESPIVQFVPGEYFFTARADKYGMYQFSKKIEAGKSYVIDVPMRKNLASSYHDDVEATGDGGNHEFLIDDAEDTNWAFLGETIDDPIEGRQVTVDLTGGAHVVREVAVSAMNRPAIPTDQYDDKAQNRFAALRSFEILACDATAGKDCEEEDSFSVIFTSPEDAFPSGRPRPTSENLRLKTFDVTDTKATHVRLRVLTNHCTGNPIYHAEANPVGEEELGEPDCVDGFTFAPLVTTDPQPDDPPEPQNTQRHRVRAAELQVFSSVTPGRPVTVDPPKKPGPQKPPVVQPPPPGQPQPPAQGPATPPLATTGGSPVLPIAGLLLATVAAAMLRRRRTA